MAINKVVLHNDDGTDRTLVDLTGDTVTPETLMQGETAHDKTGAKIYGFAKPEKPEQEYNPPIITANGKYPITPAPGKVITGGIFKVAVPKPAPKTKPLDVTKNGDYPVPAGFDGWGNVKVNVQTGGGGTGTIAPFTRVVFDTFKMSTILIKENPFAPSVNAVDYTIPNYNNLVFWYLRRLDALPAQHDIGKGEHTVYAGWGGAIPLYPDGPSGANRIGESRNYAEGPNYNYISSDYGFYCLSNQPYIGIMSKTHIEIGSNWVIMLVYSDR